MKVVIPESAILRARSCGSHLTSPYWVESERALVYPNWPENMLHLLTLENGVGRVKWHVYNRLVPTTKIELKAMLAERAKGATRG